MDKWQWDELEKEIEEEDDDECRDELAKLENGLIDSYLEKDWDNENND